MIVVRVLAPNWAVLHCMVAPVDKNQYLGN